MMEARSLLLLLCVTACLSTLQGQTVTEIEEIRLVNGTCGEYMGRVEVKYNGTWGTICDNYWTFSNARVACRMLGFRDAICAVTWGRRWCEVTQYSSWEWGWEWRWWWFGLEPLYSRGTGPIWMDNMICRGNESSLDACSFSGWRMHSCTHAQDAGVICEPVEVVAAPTDVTVVDSSTTTLTIQWNVPSNLNGTTGQCYRISYKSNTDSYTRARYLDPSSRQRNASTLNATISGLQRGTEYMIQVRFEMCYFAFACYSYFYGNYSEPIFASTNATRRPSSLQIRLVPPANGLDFMGRLEVFHNNTWGTVCDDRFRYTEANVVCGMLNYTRSVCYVRHARFGQGRGPIWMDDVDCSVEHEVLDQCSFRGWRVHDCQHRDDVGVICWPENYPGIVNNLTVTRVAATSVTLQWEPFIFPSVGTYNTYNYSCYRIRYQRPQDHYAQTKSVSSTVTQYTLRYLQLGSSYTFSIRAEVNFRQYCHSSLYGDYSDPVEATTMETDVNECTRGTDRCHSRATCHNTQGSYTCSCNTGYTGNGFSCTDVNECSRGTDRCHSRATCQNTQGSYTCTCNTGYTGSGHSCTAKNCGTLSNPANGQVSHTGGTTYGKRATYICNTGYYRVGGSTRTCLSTGRWSGSAPTCLLVSCGTLSNPANGRVSHTGTTYGQRATYICNTGYYRVGSSTRTCLSTRRWSGSAPTCLPKNCGTLSNPANGRVSHTGGTTYGKRATYSCNAGYNRAGSSTRTCLSTGRWSGSAPTCSPVDCGTLNNLMITIGQVSHTAGTTYGKRATYRCNTGYSLVGSSTRTCQAARVWSGSAPTCQDVNECTRSTDRCHRYATCHNTCGSYTCTCNNGYTGNGFSCTAVNCGTLSNPVRGRVSHTAGTTFGQTATYSCNTGYKLVGSSIRTCQATRLWSGNAPTCQDVNECTESTNSCHRHASCYNNQGSYTCSCNPGYTGNGFSCTVLLASAPTISTANSLSPNSINLIWTQPVGEAVDSFEIVVSYQGPCTGINHTSSWFLYGTARQHMLTGLKEFSNYTITMMAVNDAGKSEESSRSVVTMADDPGDSPLEVTALATSPVSFTIRWTHVLCLNRKSNITGYMVRYSTGGGSSVDVSVSGTGQSDRICTPTLLVPNTSYSIQVAAVTSTGMTGPFSAAITEKTLPPEGVIVFNGAIIPNHGFVLLENIGESIESVLMCLTDLPTCCRPPYAPMGTAAGNWYFPNETRIPSTGDNWDFHRTRGLMAVLLHRRRGGATGIYRCDIPGQMKFHNLYVGVYTAGSGGVVVLSVHFQLTSDLDATTPTFNLTCISTGGPATTVTWTRDSRVVTDDSAHHITSQVLTDAEVATYNHTLTVTGKLVGVYECNVSNNNPSSSSRMVTVVAVDHPTGLIAERLQEDSGSFRVLWTPPAISASLIGYRIYYSGANDSGSVDVDALATNITIRDRIPGVTYNITMVALSLHLPSPVIGPATVTPFLLASAPTISTANSLSPNSINLVWTQPVGEAVDSFEIVVSYQGPCTGINHTSSWFLYGTARQHMLTGLKEFSNYTVTMMAVNDAGKSEENSRSAVTMTDAPGDSPLEVTALATSPVSIIIRWGRVRCIDRKSNITGYMVRYSKDGGSSVDVSVSGTGQSDRICTPTLLAPNTSYSIQVAAVTSSGATGPFSTTITEKTLPPEGGLVLNGAIIPNHGFVLLDNIGESNKSLLCLTDLPTCCRPPYTDPDPMVSALGNWYFPNGTKVPSTGRQWDFHRTRGQIVVVLHRRKGGVTGIYRCDIPGQTKFHNLYVGVYTAGSGDVLVSYMHFQLTSELNATTPTFNLTCISTGGPATTVTWTRDSRVVTDDSAHHITSQVLTDSETATYNHTLTVTGRLVGVYGCNVSNSKPSSSSKMQSVVAVDHPTGLIAEQLQEDSGSFKVLWTSPASSANLIGYRIYYTGANDSGSMDVDALASNVTIGSCIPGVTYNITMVALSPHLPSTVIGPATVTPGISDVRFSLNDKIYQNNSLVNLEDIGEDDKALMCITDLTACCRCPYTGEMGTDMGNWFFPNGTRINACGEGTDWDFYRTRGEMVVLMQRKGGGEDGIYRCDIPDPMYVTQTIYIGVYSANTGSPSGISLTFDSKSKTFTCTSTGGPATTVTWRRDGVVITPNATHQQTKRLVYPEKGTYQTVLTIDPSVGQGTYNCTVENVRGKSSKAYVVTDDTLE